MSTLKVDTISRKSASGVITLSDEVTATLSSSSNIKAPLNATGSAPVYACRAWVNFRGASQSGTATASGLVSGQYTATVITTNQFTVEYSGTTYTINTIFNHEIGDGEGVDLTVSGTTVVIDTQIRASRNVSSITDNGSGNYTVNFTTAMPDINYAFNASHTSYAGVIGWMFFSPASASQLNIYTYGGDSSTSSTDPGIVTAIVFR